MSLSRMNEMLEDMNAQPSASEGFSAAEFYKAGQKYGVTCSEIMVNFLGKARALSRGKYPAIAPDAPLETSRKTKVAPVPKPVKAAAKKVADKTPAKPAKVVKTSKSSKKTVAKVVKTPKSIKKTVADEIEAELNADDFVTDNNSFVYIATPEEIAEG